MTVDDDLLARLDDEVLHVVIIEAAGRDISSLGRIARLSTRYARAAEAVREHCAEKHFKRLAPDLYELLTEPHCRDLAQSISNPSQSWSPVTDRTWVSRLRVLHAEKDMIAKAGLGAVWEGLNVPFRHILKEAIARELLDVTFRSESAVPEIFLRVRSHMAILLVTFFAAGRLEMHQLEALLNRAHPSGLTKWDTLGLSLILDLASSVRLPCGRAVTSFLLGAVAMEDVERAYIDLLTVQRPLLAQAELERLQAEYSVTFGLEPTH